MQRLRKPGRVRHVDDERACSRLYRFEAAKTTLQNGQKAIVSVPGCAPGAPSWALELVRDGITSSSIIRPKNRRRPLQSDQGGLRGDDTTGQ